YYYSVIPASRPGVSLVLLNTPATSEIYTLSLHDALPILEKAYAIHTGSYAKLNEGGFASDVYEALLGQPATKEPLIHSSLGQAVDRKSTRLNSSHVKISYAVFCLKKKTTAPHRRPSTRRT